MLVQKGTKNAYKRGGEGKQMMTVLFCMSAAGENIRPLIVNKGKHITAYEKAGGEIGKQYSVASSEKGWMVWGGVLSLACQHSSCRTGEEKH